MTDCRRRDPRLFVRLRYVWGWESMRTLLLISVAITVVISLFEIKLDPLAMLREVAMNFIVCASITLMITIAFAIFGWNQGRQGWKNTVWLLALLAVGGMVGGLMGWWINTLFFPFRVTDAWLYLAVVAVLSIIFGGAVVAYQGIAERLRTTASRLAEKEVQEQTLRRLKTEAELEALRAKVDPHFLFNTLNSIASLIPEDPARAEEMVQRLSNLFHYALYASQHDFVPLTKELEFVGEYLEIEKVRLGGRLSYAIDKDVALNGVVIPSMLLQPLVENSVKYGLAPLRHGGHIGIEARREGDRCAIRIFDTGKGFESGATDEGFGIGGVRQRLELIYPDNHRFDIRSGDGVTVRIEVPITHDVQNSSRG